MWQGWERAPKQAKATGLEENAAAMDCEEAATEDLIFQMVDIDYHIVPAWRIPGEMSGTRVDGASEAVVVRIFGITENGVSVCAKVYGFLPYFYIRAPECFREHDCCHVRATLDKFIAGEKERMDYGRMMRTTGGTERKGNNNNKRARPSPHNVQVPRVELVRRRPLMFYDPQDCGEVPFLKLSLTLPTMVPRLRGALEEGLLNLQLDGSTDRKFHQTYESNVLFVLRFMLDCGIQGASWIEIQGAIPRASARSATCQAEYDVAWTQVRPCTDARLANLIAPLRILSFDIECKGREGVFPQPEVDPVIQIASVLVEHGRNKGRPIKKTVLTLNSCDPILGCGVTCFDSEAELLEAWADLVRTADPDLLTGYNIVGFDLQYLLRRAEVVGAARFPYLTRVADRPMRSVKRVSSTNQAGALETFEYNLEGRVIFDMMSIIRGNPKFKFRSYSLNSVAAELLGDQKEDMHYSAIAPLQDGDASTRCRIATYCLKDAVLPLDLMNKLMEVVNHVQMARTTGVALSHLLFRGQSIRAFTYVVKKANLAGYLVPNVKSASSQNPDANQAPLGFDEYEGATVLDPVKGFYNEDIATLDFASLYPSIMRAHNLCYTTLVPPDKVRLMSESDITRTPSGDVFVKPHVRQGLVPAVETELMAAREVAKKDLKGATDDMVKAVLDGRQMCLKIVCNALYGFTGASVGQLPCVQIASSTTAFGRQMIEQTKQYVETTYTLANGYPADAKVIYGDTDSVFVKFGSSDLTRTMRLAIEAAQNITRDIFIPPIRLEFEKVYSPFLLLGKKRYAGEMYVEPKGFPEVEPVRGNYHKMDQKGLETQRRDNFRLIGATMQRCLDHIIHDRSPKKAVEHVHGVVSDLLQSKVDMSLLVLSQKLAKLEYKSPTPHSEVAKRLRERDPGSAPRAGDRVPYVIKAGPKGCKAHELAEDPIYCLDNDVPLNTQFYLERLEKALVRIFDPISENPKRLLFEGDHMRTVKVQGSSSKVGIMKFTKPRETCEGCRTTLPPKRTVLCEHCEERRADIVYERTAVVNRLETECHATWETCHKCVGDKGDAEACSAIDCRLFYRRKTVRKQLAKAQACLDRFAPPKDFAW